MTETKTHIIFNASFVTYMVYVANGAISWTRDRDKASRFTEADATTIARPYGYVVKHIEDRTL